MEPAASSHLRERERFADFSHALPQPLEEALPYLHFTGRETEAVDSCRVFREKEKQIPSTEYRFKPQGTHLGITTHIPLVCLPHSVCRGGRLPPFLGFNSRAGMVTNALFSTQFVTP